MTEITGGTYYHVAGTDYEPGDDLLSWQAYEERYGAAPGPWKWEGDPIDTDIVCLFATIAEAREMQAEYGGTILIVAIPDRPRELNLLTGSNDEGYPYVMHRIPANYIAVAS